VPAAEVASDGPNRHVDSGGLSWRVAREAATRRESRIPVHSLRRAGQRARRSPGVWDFIQTLRLSGASFESADDEELNNWHERLNVTWRNIASPNFALWSTSSGAESGLRRHGQPVGLRCDAGGRYFRRLGHEVLMVNEIYLSVLYRPVVGAAPGLIARMLSRAPAGASAPNW